MLFSLPAGTEMFHFPAFPPHALYIQAQVTGNEPGGVTPFGNPRITARLPAPRGLSQAPTSFIGSWCQGIHRMPLQTCNTHTNTTPQREAMTRHARNHRNKRCSRPLCSSQATRNPEPHTRHHNPQPETTQSEWYARKDRPATRRNHHPHTTSAGGPVPSGPNSVPTTPPTQPPHFPTRPPGEPRNRADSPATTQKTVSSRCSTHEQPPPGHPPEAWPPEPHPTHQ